MLQQFHQSLTGTVLVADDQAPNRELLEEFLSAQGLRVITVSAPDPACLTPNMTLTVTTSGGPVLVMANIGGVQINSVNSCDIVSFYLVMDNRFISTQQFYGWDNQYPVFTVTMMALPVPAAGTHTFQVQEADDPNDGECGSGDYYPTIVSWRLETVGPGPTRTLIVREF